ncbi:MAG: hypothetical protein ACUVTC_04115 [Candidatus Bathycorpusculaceae bacterium]
MGRQGKALTREPMAVQTKEIKINAMDKRFMLLPKRYLPSFAAG